MARAVKVKSRIYICHGICQNPSPVLSSSSCYFGNRFTSKQTVATTPTTLLACHLSITHPVFATESCELSFDKGANVCGNKAAQDALEEDTLAQEV